MAIGPDFPTMSPLAAPDSKSDWKWVTLGSSVQGHGEHMAVGDIQSTMMAQVQANWQRWWSREVGFLRRVNNTVESDGSQEQQRKHDEQGQQYSQIQRQQQRQLEQQRQHLLQQQLCRELEQERQQQQQQQHLHGPQRRPAETRPLQQYELDGRPKLLIQQQHQHEHQQQIQPQKYDKYHPLSDETRAWQYEREQQLKLSCQPQLKLSCQPQLQQNLYPHGQPPLLPTQSKLPNQLHSFKPAHPHHPASDRQQDDHRVQPEHHHQPGAHHQPDRHQPASQHHQPASQHHQPANNHQLAHDHHQPANNYQLARGHHQPAKNHQLDYDHRPAGHHHNHDDEFVPAGPHDSGLPPPPDSSPHPLYSPLTPATPASSDHSPAYACLHRRSNRDRVSKSYRRDSETFRRVSRPAKSTSAPPSAELATPELAASEPAAPEPRPLKIKKAKNPPDTDFLSVENFCPPTDALDDYPDQFTTSWKPPCRRLDNDPDRYLLHPAELKVASTLRLSCATYLTSKRRIFMGLLKNMRIGKPFRKTDSQKACNIDVNKASKLWELFNAMGWFTKDAMKRWLETPAGGPRGRTAIAGQELVAPPMGPPPMGPPPMGAAEALERD